MPFEFQKLLIPEIILIKPKVYKDDRGLFIETYKFSDFSNVGIKENFVQDNYSRSKKNVLRGLHYQINPAAQGKLIRCLHGSIFDVAVYIRKGSPTYGKCVSSELSEENAHMLYIPAGFAHGFLVTSDIAGVVYGCTFEYSSANDRGIIWNDSNIAIKWPVANPILSDKDKEHKTLDKADNNFEYLKGTDLCECLKIS